MKLLQKLLIKIFFSFCSTFLMTTANSCHGENLVGSLSYPKIPYTHHSTKVISVSLILESSTNKMEVDRSSALKIFMGVCKLNRTSL